MWEDTFVVLNELVCWRWPNDRRDYYIGGHGTPGTLGGFALLMVPGTSDAGNVAARVYVVY
jgi:hypothetical protein